MAEITAPAAKPGARTKRTHKSTRVDLTPMVDLGFLLVTFFVFSTTLSQPRTMQLIEPREGASLPVAASGTLTLMPGAHHQVHYYQGLFVPGKIATVSIENVRDVIMQHKRAVPLHKLMYVIKPGSASTFADNVDLLDELAICAVPAGHYAEAALSPEEALSLRLRKVKHRP